MGSGSVKNVVLLVLGLFLVTFLYFNHSSRPWQVRHLPAAGNKVLFFGDEIPEAFLYSHQKEFEVIKVIENEATSASLAKMFTSTIEAYHPNAVVISAGTYDLMAGTSWDEIYAHLDEMFEIANKAKLPVIFIGVYPSAGGDNYPFGIRDACKKHGVLLIDNLFGKVWHDGIEGTLSSLTPDQIREMHETIFYNIRSLYSDR